MVDMVTKLKRDMARKIRETKGLNQKVVSGMVGISQGYLSELLSSKKRGDFDLLVKIAGVIGTDIGQYLSPQTNETVNDHSPDHSAPVENLNTLPKNHQTIERFKNQPLAELINDMMVEVEQIDPERLIQIKFYVSDMLDSLKRQTEAEEGAVRGKDEETPPKAIGA